jgi:pyruvate formate lyase activating enzyme
MEALLYKKIEDNKVRCGLCERRCIIGIGKRGFCQARINIDGKLHTLVYGNISAIESRPIEIKPFFHFYPGSTALTYSAWSCNFACPWCQNYHLSKRKPNSTFTQILPEDIVKNALKAGDAGLCVSFNEPTLLFEHCLDTFKLAKKEGLYNSFVSNGYMTKEALLELKNAGLDAIKIDVKGDSYVYKKYCKDIDVDKVWQTAKEAHQLGLHLEIVNLIITDVNDKIEQIKGLILRHLKETGEEVPLHFTRYHPDYLFHNPPTQVETLIKAYDLAKKEGVLYPYLGNVPGHKYENTYCPECKKLLIKRFNYQILDYQITNDNLCPDCNCHIPITGRYIKAG